MVPTRLVLRKVLEIQHAATFLSYARRRDEIFAKLRTQSEKLASGSAGAAASTAGLPAFIRFDNPQEKRAVRTLGGSIGAGADADTAATGTGTGTRMVTTDTQAEVVGLSESMTIGGGSGVTGRSHNRKTRKHDFRHRITPSLNEFYLFHGTKPEAAQAICNSDFRIDLAGTHRGTLYGNGVYLAESCLKSDEYTQASSWDYRDEQTRFFKGKIEPGWRPLLLCRATLGRVRYTDKRSFAGKELRELVASCVDVNLIRIPGQAGGGDDGGFEFRDSQYHSVLGDREKTVGTYREFIVYDNDQVLPEYVLWYTRES